MLSFWHLLKTAYSFAESRVFMLLHIWMISWSLPNQSMLARGHKHILLSFCSSWEYLFFHIWPCFTQCLLLRTVLGSSRCICTFAIWQTSWDTAVGSFFVTEAICYSLSGHVLLGEDNLFCQWTCRTPPVVSCYLDWYVECFTISSSFFSHFPSSTALASLTISVAGESIPIVISFSWCAYCHRCYNCLWGILFSGFWDLFIL